jgi:hypothetical protein
MGIAWALGRRGRGGAAKGIDITDSRFRAGDEEEAVLGIGMLADLAWRVLMVVGRKREQADCPRRRTVCQDSDCFKSDCCSRDALSRPDASLPITTMVSVVYFS